MNQHTLLAVAMVPLIATFSAGCSSPESSRSFSVERLEAPPVGGGLGAGAVAPLTLSPGSGNASGQVVRVRGLSAAARSGLIADDGYLVCDKNNTGKCNTLSRKPIGVSFGIDSAIPYDSSTPLTNLYYADLPYAVDSDAPDRQVVPITFLDRNLSGTEDDILYEQDYRVPVSNVTQVFNYLSNHATEADLAAQDQYFGATAFLPPDYTFAYTTLLSGALAVVNTDTDSGQQPAQVDLAFTRPAGGAVQVFQGTVAGGIGFVARTTKITIPQPKAIATGDFDEDGDLDLAVANSGGNTVAIFRADGIADTVSFPNGSTFTVGYGPSALAVGDIDKDGHVDIAVTLAGTSVPDCSAVVLWGAGAGSFTTGATISAGTAATEMPTGIAIGTLDGDAYPELVIAKHDRTSPNAGHVRTLLNQGSGAHTFSGSTTYSVGDKPAGIVLADFNGDSFLDAATPNSGSSSVSVALGDGAGGFAAPSSFPVDAPPQAITSGYLNDDAVLDLATANDRAGNNDTVSILIGSGTGTFTNTTNFGVLPNNTNVDAQPRAIVVGEWTEDEYADIAVTAYNTSQIAAFGNNSNNPGTFSAPVTINNLGNPWGLVSGQFDTQKEDVLYLGNPDKAVDEGRNVGYGIVIVEYPAGSGQYFAFLTNHNQDNPRSTQDTCGQFVGDDFQKYVGNTVTVVRINPAQFAPTNERTANDEVIATLQVGCGPHGIDATSDGAYLFVANEYDGTVSRIDVTAALSPLPDNPFAPTMQGVTATIDVKPSGYPSTAGSVLTVSRGIDIVEGIPGAGANGATGTRAFATVAYPLVGNPSQKGRIAVIRDLTSGNPSVEGWLTGDGQQFLGAPSNPRISLGGQPLGVTALLRDGRRRRWWSHGSMNLPALGTTWEFGWSSPAANGGTARPRTRTFPPSAWSMSTF